MAYVFNPFTGNLDDTGSAGTPAGSTGAVQFNNAGAFGADTTNFFWDDTLKKLRLTSSNVTGITTDAALSLVANSITSGTGFYLSTTSLTSGALFDLNVSTTGASGSTQKVVQIATQGANANSGQVTYGFYAVNTHTGTSSTNIAAYYSASGGTNNYAAIFDGGRVGVGITAPQVDFHIRSTTGATMMRVESIVAANTSNTVIADFLLMRTTSGQTRASSILSGLSDIGDATYKGYFVINTANAAAPAERVRVDHVGSVRITNTSDTGTTNSSAFSVTANSLTTGTGVYFGSSSLSSGKAIDVQVTGTAALTNQTGLNIAVSGATSTNAQTTYGAQVSNTRTNATSGTNVGLYLNASGATTANYALLVNAGNVGFGTLIPTQALEVAGIIYSNANQGEFRLNASDTGLSPVIRYLVGGVEKGTMRVDNTPLYKFELNGSLTVQFATAGRIQIGTGALTVLTDSTTFFRLGDSAGWSNGCAIYGSSTEMIRVRSSGVGILTTSANSSLQVAGSFSLALTTKTANYTATATDSLILVDSTSGAVTITLPTAVNITGRHYTIKDWKGQSATNNITIATTSSQTIDGETTVVLAITYGSITVVSDGANWSIT